VFSALFVQAIDSSLLRHINLITVFTSCLDLHMMYWLLFTEYFSKCPHLYRPGNYSKTSHVELYMHTLFYLSSIYGIQCRGFDRYFN